MKRNLLEDEFYDKEISDFLESYVLEEASEEKIEETIDVLKEYMPREKERYPLLKVIKNQLTFISREYIAISLMLILLGIVAINNLVIPMYHAISIITPIPSIIGLIELSKSKREKVWELEKSFKYSYSLVTLARAIIILGISFFINTIFTVTLCNVDNGVFLKCLTSWIVPISIIFSIELVLYNKIPTIYTSIGLSITWIGVLNLFYGEISRILEKSSNITLTLAICISIAACIGALFKYYKNEKNYEGDILWN